MGFNQEAKIYEEVSKTGIMGKFILDTTLEEFEKAGSKFASEGLHLAEMGMPEWEQEGKSIRFPFIITEGIDNGKEGKLVGGVSKAAQWKIREILDAVGVKYASAKGGGVTFDENDCVGKSFKVLYVTEVDKRSPEEGGKGTTYTKATKAYPADTTNESLGI